jgi:hypothetical protein
MACGWIDAIYLKVRRGGRIVAVAVIIAVGANVDGRQEVFGGGRHLRGKAVPDKIGTASTF